jgi:hypothetical protein
MVFNSTLLITGIAIGFLIWLSIISVLLIRMISHYNRLSKGVTKQSLLEVLESMLNSLQDMKSRSVALEKVTRELQADGALHVQRIGIVRFNPFADTGGAQSFSIALLDGKNSGIVMTSLYARAGNRWYIKEIIAGKGKDLALSKEEESAIDNAKHIGGIS